MAFYWTDSDDHDTAPRSFAGFSFSWADAWTLAWVTAAVGFVTLGWFF